MVGYVRLENNMRASNAVAGEWMRSGRFDTMSLAAGFCLALALPASGVAQQQPLRYTPPKAPALQLMQPNAAPPLLSVTPDGKATVVEGIVVRVNDKAITRSDVQKAQIMLNDPHQQPPPTPVQLMQAQRDLLRDMIDEQLLASRGAQMGLNVEADVIRQLDSIRKQFNMDSMEALQKAVNDQGQSFEDFKAQIRNKIITQQVISEEVARRMQRPTPQEETDFYNAHISMFQQPEQVGLSEILVPAPADPTDAVIAQARAKADSIVAELKAGADFAEEAKKNSGGPTATQGGELGVYKKGVLGAVYDDQTFPLPVGGVTSPIHTRQGFVILKVTQHIAAGPQPLKDVETEIQSAMFQEEMQPALRTYLTKLRDDAFIDIAPGYTDTGASPNEAKAVFAAATPLPVAKVKKPKTTDSRFERSSKPTGAGVVPSLPPASSNGSSTMTASSTKPGKKPKKIKREKIRYGQAPRNSLAPGVAEVAPEPTGDAAPGVPVVAQSTETATNTPPDDVNPLEAKPTEVKKTRYSATEPYHGPKKPKALTAKEREREISRPAALTAEEKQQQDLQNQSLGLNGDNSKKPKKVKQKKVKGQPEPAKDRIQARPAPVAPAQPAPTVNPTITAPIQGAAPADSTPAAK